MKWGRGPVYVSSEYVEPYAEASVLSNTYFNMDAPILGPNFLYPKTNMFICGEGGVGKSIFTLDLAVHLARGEDFLHFKIDKPHRVLFVQTENDLSLMAQRLKLMDLNLDEENLPITFLNPKKIMKYRFYPFYRSENEKDLDRECSDFFFGIFSGAITWETRGKNVTGLDQETVPDGQLGSFNEDGEYEYTPVYREVDIAEPPPEVDREFLMFSGEVNKPDVVIIDPLISFHAADENNNVQMRTVLDKFAFHARTSKTAIIFVHHMGKPNFMRGEGGRQQSYRGASAIKDFTDTMFNLYTSTDETPNEILMELEKLRCGDASGVNSLRLFRNDKLNHEDMGASLKDMKRAFNSQGYKAPTGRPKEDKNLQRAEWCIGEVYKMKQVEAIPVIQEILEDWGDPVGVTTAKSVFKICQKMAASEAHFDRVNNKK